MIFDKQGYIDYYVKIDLDLEKKLFDAFGSKATISSKITKENLKPYFDKHHISFDTPFLNKETEEELLKFRQINKTTDELIQI